MLGFGENKNKEIEGALETGDMGNLDPMADAPLENQDMPEEIIVEEPEIPTEKPATKELTPEEVASRLENNGQADAQEKAQEGKPIPQTPAPFDVSALTPEQIQQLKRILNDTPDRPSKKSEGSIIQLREIEGKILKDFGKVFNGYVSDPEEPTRKISTPKIKVWLFGQDEPVEMKYEDFMQSERVKFKVLSQRTEVDEIEEGETTSNETGQLVTMIATYHTAYFTVQLPDGSKVEVSGKVANA